MASFLTCPREVLLTCPREVRDLIYKHCLIVSVEINIYPTAHEINTQRFQTSKAQRPSPALLAVNTIIGAEARQVLYARNHWQIGPNLPTENIFKSYPTLFRNVTMVFDQYDVPEEQRMAIQKAAHSRSEESWDVEDIYLTRLRSIHLDCLHAAYGIWRGIQEVIIKLMETSNITLDLENFYCPSGCCRSELLRSRADFHDAFLYLVEVSPSMVIKGLLNDEERDLIRGDHLWPDNRLQVMGEEEEVGEVVEDE